MTRSALALAAAALFVACTNSPGVGSAAPIDDEDAAADARAEEDAAADVDAAEGAPEDADAG